MGPEEARAGLMVMGKPEVIISPLTFHQALEPQGLAKWNGARKRGLKPEKTSTGQAVQSVCPRMAALPLGLAKSSEAAAKAALLPDTPLSPLLNFHSCCLEEASLIPEVLPPGADSIVHSALSCPLFFFFFNFLPLDFRRQELGPTFC